MKNISHLDKDGNYKKDEDYKLITHTMITDKYTGKERFWSKINIKGPNDCWDWTAGLFSNGYGQFQFCEYKPRHAHVVAWELTNGNIPKGKLILHKCDNKKCCNPNHLYCGTYGDNVRDVENRGLGNHHILSSLHECEIWLVRKLRLHTGGEGKFKYKFPATFVSKMFKVHPSTISRLWRSDRWLCKEGYYV